MALKEKTQAPNFTLPSTDGRDFTLHQDAKGKAVILYFYPKDFTSGCTQQACEFRDHFDFFRDLDIPVYGISRDSVETHQRFRKEHNLPFHLLADEDGNVAGLYKATVPLINFTRRITYLLDSNHTIVSSFEKLFGAKKHIEEMVNQLIENNMAG
ncbi:peroxiredoxin [Cesiribacter sp. SM1]|uniref:peroxiredoxin n=1 Tax=Cesiribacter sp. SM1 TaxID=2861196 RepID=UPI001CD7F6BF|nr:peroxiredoxin [Cesiribacter sp. SM1]